MIYSEVAAMVDLAESDPRAAVARAETLDDSNSVTEQIGTRWGAGIAFRTLGDADRSIEEMLLARDLAAAAADDVLASDIDVTLAGSFAVAGRVDEGYDLVRRAGDQLPDELKPHAWVQEATFAARQGDLDRAFELFENSESQLRRNDDMPWLGRLYNNRGLICVYVGQVERALSDLRNAIDVFSVLGFSAALAEASHNLGFAHVERGDLAAGLAMYESAERGFRRLEYPLNELLLDHTEALIAAGMYDIASDKAAELAAIVGDATMALDRAETFFLYARASFLAGDWKTSAEAASFACQAFNEVGGVGWFARSELLEMRAKEQMHSEPSALAVEATADVAIKAGQLMAGWHGLLMAARIHARQGDSPVSKILLERVRRDTSNAGILLAELVLDVALTEIEIDQTEARHDDAFATAREAIRWLNESSEATESSGRSAGSMVRRIESLERIGTDLAVMRGSEALLEWTASVRNAATRHLPLVRSVDPSRASILDNIRDIDDRLGDGQSIETIVEKVRALDGLSGEVQTQADSPVAVGQGARLVFSSGRSVTYSSLQLGERSLLVGSAQTSDVLSLADEVRLGLARVNISSDFHDAERLQSMLMGDVDIASDAVSVSSPKQMVSLPWTSLPNLSAKALSIEASVRRFHGRRMSGVGRTIAVAGPRLAFANDEVLQIVSKVTDGHAIDSNQASREVVLRAMQRSTVFHFAGHSVFRVDNPGLSYLDLRDGRLHAWELEQLESVPTTVVLASCSSGGVGLSGEGVAGLVGTLLALGVREVVASVVPVPDTQATSDLMVMLHEGLSEGRTAADALRNVRMTTGVPSAHTFQVFV